MTQAKPTPGPWLAVGSRRIEAACQDTLAYVHPQFDNGVSLEEATAVAQANLSLIAEAGTVYHETQLTPRQLLEQRDILMAAIKELLSFELADQIEGDIDGAYLHQTHELKAAIYNVKEAIAKIESTQTKGD